MTGRVEEIAAGIFRHYGVGFSTAVRARGWSNATWLAGGLALRIALCRGTDKIRREGRLAALLPPDAGYPVNVETGVTDGYEWSLSERIPGMCLGDAWPDLDWRQRCDAIRQVWEIIRAVHGVSVSAAGDLAGRKAWFSSFDPGEAAGATDRLARQGLFTSTQADRLSGYLARFFGALPGAATVLNHGDLSMDNLIWHEGRVVSLLDFEYAVIAPPELDINFILKFAFGPEENAADLEDRQRRGLFTQEISDLFRTELENPRSIDLLLGYAVLLEQRILELWLSHPEGEGPLERWEPYRRLLALADGKPYYPQR